MKAQRISDKAPILCHPAVVFVIIYVLTAFVILTDYDLPVVAVCSFIALGFITLASILRDIDIDDKQMFIGGPFARSKVVELVNIRYVKEGKVHPGSYDIIYIDDKGKNQSATFYPITNEEYNIIEPALSFLEYYKS